MNFLAAWGNHSQHLSLSSTLNTVMMVGFLCYLLVSSWPFFDPLAYLKAIIKTVNVAISSQKAFGKPDFRLKSVDLWILVKIALIRIDLIKPLFQKTIKWPADKIPILGKGFDPSFNWILRVNNWSIKYHPGGRGQTECEQCRFP